MSGPSKEALEGCICVCTCIYVCIYTTPNPQPSYIHLSGVGPCGEGGPPVVERDMNM